MTKSSGIASYIGTALETAGRAAVEALQAGRGEPVGPPPAPKQKPRKKPVARASEDRKTERKGIGQWVNELNPQPSVSLDELIRIAHRSDVLLADVKKSYLKRGFVIR